MMTSQQLWRLPDSEIRNIFGRAAEKSSDRFLLVFAGAIVLAGSEDFSKLRPVAELFIQKYALE